MVWAVAGAAVVVASVNDVVLSFSSPAVLALSALLSFSSRMEGPRCPLHERFFQVLYLRLEHFKPALWAAVTAPI